jgi:hypothetical protein
MSRAHVSIDLGTVISARASAWEQVGGEWTAHVSAAPLALHGRAQTKADALAIVAGQLHTLAVQLYDAADRIEREA